MSSSPIVVTGRHEAWVVTEPVGQSQIHSGVPKRLWHTTNDGETWSRVWVDLGADAPFVQVTRS